MPVDKVDSTSGAPVSQGTEPNPNPESAPQQFTLKDGTVVNQDELVSGYMRQQDYTRKTQGLSQERQRVEAASQLLSMLETDPQGTLSYLAQYYGQGSNQSPSNADDLDEPDQIDPRLAQFEERLSQQEALIEQQVSRQADEYLTQQMGKVQQLAEQFGIELDEDELIQHALTNQEADPVKAFYGLYGEELPQRAQQKAIQEYSAKRGLPVQRQGLNAPRGVQKRPNPRNLREALSYTLEDAGIGDLNDLPIE